MIIWNKIIADYIFAQVDVESDNDLAIGKDFQLACYIFWRKQEAKKHSHDISSIWSEDKRFREDPNGCTRYSRDGKVWEDSYGCSGYWRNSNGLKKIDMTAPVTEESSVKKI